MTKQLSAEDIIKLKADLKVAKRQLRTAYNLLDRAQDAIPIFTDGRYDSIFNAIFKWRIQWRMWNDTTTGNNPGSRNDFISHQENNDHDKR